MINIVISGPNFTSGGPLSVLEDLLKTISKYKNFNITALVHSKKLFNDETYGRIEFLEFPDSKSSWKNRINYEYRDFYLLSKKLKPDIWLSMHDITPNVETKFLATYCHNPSPFYKLKLKDFLYDKKFGLFNLFYKYLYRINIRKNDYIFVQQNWIKKEFEKMFSISNVIVAKPNINISIIKNTEDVRQKRTTFFYPSFPRVFKNFEVICQAVQYLETKQNIKKFKVYLTIDGSEEKYSKDIVNKFKHLDSIKFIGLLSRDDVFNYYNKSDVLIFPSKLETWGLPISEFKEYEKPMLVSDLDYAKETVGNYEKVNFFPPENYKTLAKLMEMHINGKIKFDGNSYTNQMDLIGWDKFIEFIEFKYKEKLKD